MDPLETTPPTPAPADAAPVETAPHVRTDKAREASKQKLLQSLNPKQQEQFAKIEAAKAAAKSATPANPQSTVEKPDTAAKTAPAKKEEPAAEVEDFGADPDKPAAATEETTLTEDEVAALDDKTRKIYKEAMKEAAKVRKRAQEAETRATEAEAKADAATKAATDAAGIQSRALALAGNDFHSFTDAHQVAAWGTNANNALVLLAAHDKAIKAGRAEEGDAIEHELPNGETIQITTTDKDWLKARATHAQEWFTRDVLVSKSKEAADTILKRHSSTKGYAEVHKAILADVDLHSKLSELAAKAAYYDNLMARKAVVTFPDAASAATNAPSNPAEKTQGNSATKKAPPSESAPSAPRMVHADNPADDVRSRKSQLMEQARTAKTATERNRLIKESIKLGNPDRIRQS